MNPPEPQSATDHILDAQAAEWLAQREMGFTPDQEAEFLRWRLADPRHAAAVGRMEETCELLGALPALGSDARLEPPARAAGATAAHEAESTARGGSGGRNWRGFGIGLAAALGLAGIAWWTSLGLGPAPAQMFATAPAGYQRVLLSDNSLVQLNSSTALQVEYSRAERHIALAEGEAHFSVAKDATRPFVVQARGTRVSAVGTAFNVRLTAAGVDVLVTEGVVRIERLADPAGAIVLAAHERALVSEEPAAVSACVIERVEPTVVRAVLAWQEPRFVFVEAPLGEVVRRFNARNRVQLELADASLAGRVVGGTFRSDEVETFLRLLESSGEIAVDRSDPTRLVLRRGR
jgi:transmembrane sensor